MQVVEMAILATDLASYFDKRAKFLSIADAGEIDWQVQYCTMYMDTIGQ